MKYRFPFAIFTMLCFIGPVMSQRQFSFGFAATGLTSVITNQNNYGLPFEMGYLMTFGASCNVNIGLILNNRMALKSEIGFAKLGQNYRDTYNDTLYTRNIKLNYLQVPLMFKYITGGSSAKYYVMAGPQLNFLISASQKYFKNKLAYADTVPGNRSKPSLIGDEKITDRYNSLDIMMRVDLGAEIPLADNLFLNAALSMGFGLTDINANGWKINDHTNNYHSSHTLFAGVTVGINYLLPPGNK